MSIKNFMHDALIENTLTVSHFARLSVRIDGIPTNNIGHSTTKDPKLRLTNGAYAIQYEPRTGKWAFAPYVVVCDIFGDLRGRMRVRDYEELLKFAKEKEEVKWFVDNTNVSKEHFDLAKENILMNIPVTFDPVKYSKKIGTKKFRNEFLEELTVATYKAKKEAKGQKCI